MSRSPNGGVFSPANLQADSDFVVINTVIGHATGDFGDVLVPSNAQNLEKLIEMIMTKVNVKYIKVSSAVVDLSDAGVRAVYGLGTGFNQAATTVYTIKFMSEQTKFISTAIINALIEGVAVVNPTLAVPHNAAPADQTAYNTASAAEKNIVVTVSDLF